MKLRLLALSMMMLGSLASCGGSPACTAEQSQACTDMLTACQTRCDPTSASCMQDCATADCNCHANYRCPSPGGC